MLCTLCSVLHVTRFRPGKREEIWNAGWRVPRRAVLQSCRIQHPLQIREASKIGEPWLFDESEKCMM